MNLDSKIYFPSEYVSQSELKPEGPDSSKKQSENNSIWSFAYYQRFYEVTTDQVLNRLVWSMFPKPGINFYKDFIQNNPDLYGPVWISLTLILTVTVAGNLRNYFLLSASGETNLPTSGEVNLPWKYDFHLISLAATCVLSYCWLLPLIMWGLIKWKSSDQIKVSYLELTCVYGYCITIFIPISVLWVIQINWLQWLLACLGTFLSGTVLLKSIIPLTGSNNYFFNVTIFCCHFLLSLSLLWNFFQGSQPVSHLTITTTRSVK